MITSEREKHWTEYLAADVLPTDEQRSELESLRQRLGLEHKQMADDVRCSPASLRRICETVLARLTIQCPGKGEAELLRRVYAALWLTQTHDGAEDPASSLPDELNRNFARHLLESENGLESAASQMRGLDDLVRFMLAEPEFQAYRNRDLPGCDEIDRILGGDDPVIAVTDKSSLIVPFAPSWLKALPPTLRAQIRNVKRLDELRTDNRIGTDEFALLILQSPGVTKILLEQQVRDLRRRRPEATDKELFRALLNFRYFTTDVADGMTLEDATSLLARPWRQSLVGSIAEDMETIDDVARYVVEEYEEFWRHASDSYGVNAEIAELLGYHQQASKVTLALEERSTV
jgi:hypothetical protein